MIIEDYQEYLKSDYWKQVADAVKARDGYKCKVCNSGEKLVAHHRCHDHAGDELNHLGDLTTLCDGCHTIYHRPMTRNGRTFASVMPDRKPAVKKAPKVKTMRNAVSKPKYPQAHPQCWFFINPTTRKRLACTSKALAWFKNEMGVNTREKGWTRLITGKIAPLFCLQEKKWNTPKYNRYIFDSYESAKSFMDLWSAPPPQR